MRARRSILPVLALSIALASSATAQAPSRKPFMGGMTVNHMSIDPVVASGQMIGARSFGMQFDGGVTLGRFVYAGVDFAPQFLSDRGTFTQNTTLGEKQSTAMLMYFSALAGVRTGPMRLIPGLPATSLGVYGGTSGTKGERSIENCVDCSTQDIAVAGGTFVQPTLVFGSGSKRLRISDRHFVSGKGIRTVLSAGMEFGGK